MNESKIGAPVTLPGDGFWTDESAHSRVLTGVYISRVGMGYSHEGALNDARRYADLFLADVGPTLCARVTMTSAGSSVVATSAIPVSPLTATDALLANVGASLAEVGAKNDARKAPNSREDWIEARVARAWANKAVVCKHLCDYFTAGAVDSTLRPEVCESSQRAAGYLGIETAFTFTQACFDVVDTAFRDEAGDAYDDNFGPQGFQP